MLASSPLTSPRGGTLARPLPACSPQPSPCVSARRRNAQRRGRPTAARSSAGGLATDERLAAIEPAPQVLFDSSRLQSMGVPAALQSTLYAVCSLAGDLDAEGTSFVCSRLPLHSFLDQALNATQEGRLCTPRVPLLVLGILSCLRFGSPAAAEPYVSLYNRAASSLMEAADAAGVYGLRCTTIMAPQEVLEYFECAARMGAPVKVYKGAGFGHTLAHHLRQSRFEPQHLVRLLEAWAELRVGGEGYNPDTLNFRRLTQCLQGGLSLLTPEELLRVVVACRSFEWPVYSSMVLVEGVCSAVLTRIATGELPATSGQRILEAAVDTAGHYRPALRDSLRAKLAAALLGQQALQPEQPAAAQQPAGRPSPHAAPSGTSPVNNAVVGLKGLKRRPAKKTTGLLAVLPAAALLVVPALQKLPPSPLALFSALALVSLVAASDV